MSTQSEVQQQVYDLLSKTSNLSFVSAESATGGTQSLGLSPGQRVSAEVLSGSQGSRVPVRIGNQQVNLEIPMVQVRPGQNLELTFVGDGPRLTFAMARPDVAPPPVSLTDASRLLSLLVSNEQMLDPRLRSSLQSIGDLLRRSSGDASVLANFLDDFLTYRSDGRTAVVNTGGVPDNPQQQVGQGLGEQSGAMSGWGGRTPSAFEDAASKLLLNLAQNARFKMVEVVNQPLNPLPMQPGEEANALVQGSLPGGRVLVQLAGESLELQLSRPVQQGEVLRLTLISQQPKVIFALMGQPGVDRSAEVSDAARWLNAITKEDTAQNDMQRAVLSRLQQVISSLPPGSPALAAIMDEAMTYGALPWLSSRLLQQGQTSQMPLSDDSGDEVFRLLQSLMHGNRLALIEPDISPDRFASIQPGQQLKAEVLQDLGNGRFMIQLAGQNLEVLLPKGIKPGEFLNLFFAGQDPPVFLLLRQGKTGDAVVSQTGRWLSLISGAQGQATSLQEGLGILRTILQGVPSDPALLQRELAERLKESGLFYESHLSRWFMGDYRLESLVREPQGRLSNTMPGLAEAQPQSFRDMSREVAESVLKAQAKGLPDGADPRVLPIIKEQLATLQTGHLLFHGELFPGQPMEWRISEREADGGRDPSEGDRPWETSLSITLPGLGKVDASISLDGVTVDIKVKSGSKTTVEKLSGGIGELLEQFEAAGLEPRTIEVTDYGERAQKK